MKEFDVRKHKKYVYLFELDSVRQTDEEILLGQQALYNEVVENGNVVVLTYNQLIDSRGFFSLLDDENYFNHFVNLFENGYIQLSQFGTIRTLAQYLLNTIDSENNEFIYSALPIKRSQRRLIALIKRSLMYSDLSEINEYPLKLPKGNKHSGGSKSDEALMDLFVEAKSIRVDDIETIEETPSSLDLDTMKNTLGNIFCLLKLALRLSTIHCSFVPPKDPREYANFKLNNYIKYICDIHLPETEDPLWNSSVDVLNQIDSSTDNRSLYFRKLKELSETEAVARDVLQYAEAIVNICTNYAYEMSIYNISKHYDFHDLEETPSMDSSFFRDFRWQLERHWHFDEDIENRFLRDESDTFTEFDPKSHASAMPDFSRACRILTNRISDDSCGWLPQYGYKLKQQRRAQKFSLLKKIPKQLLSLLVAMALLFVLAVLLACVEEVISELFTHFSLFPLFGSQFLDFSIKAIVLFIISEFLTGFIASLFPIFLPLSQACSGLVHVLCDTCYLLFLSSKTITSNIGADGIENRNRRATMDFAETAALKQYKDFCEKHPLLMAPASEYPIANLDDPDTLKTVLRYQELSRQQYGVVYHSHFNMLVVDPIERADHSFFSYERIVPTSLKNSVVLLTMRDNKFVLLQQFRHAIRRVQLCCPRGFGNTGIDAIDNAKKELAEELKATSAEAPIKLGTVTADSGLSSGNATVYLVKVQEYVATNTEGIRAVVELDPEEMQDKIQAGEIDDGYTLAAFALYSAYTASQENPLKKKLV